MKIEHSSMFADMPEVDTLELIEVTSEVREHRMGGYACSHACGCLGYTQNPDDSGSTRCVTPLSASTVCDHEKADHFAMP